MRIFACRENAVDNEKRLKTVFPGDGSINEKQQLLARRFAGATHCEAVKDNSVYLGPPGFAIEVIRMHA